MVAERQSSTAADRQPGTQPVKKMGHLCASQNIPLALSGKDEPLARAVKRLRLPKQRMNGPYKCRRVSHAMLTSLGHSNN